MFISALLMALALCVDSLVVSTAASFRSRITKSRGVLLAAVFALFQGGMPLAGSLIGLGSRRYVEAVDHWIAFVLLAAVGGRMIYEALRPHGDEPNVDFTSLRMIVLMALATSIDAFVVGIGFGLSMSVVELTVNIIVITAATFVVSLLGVALGRRNTIIPERYAGLIAGIVLIGLGVKTLIEHLWL